jgi:glycosyltransferase involved in cell wall biosynthesis
MLAVLPLARVLWPKAKFVYDVHEDFPNLMLIRDWLPARLKPLARALTGFCESSLARLAHGIVAVTPPLASKFPHRNKVAALNFPTPDFIDAAARAARPATERAYDLVHLGTLSRQRAAFLAEVIDELSRRRPGTQCLILGTSPANIDFLKTRVPPSCELLGSVAHAEVAGILGNAKVGIDVHPWLQPHLEPALAVKIGEYMVCGCAVIASSMPVLETILSRSTVRLPGIATIEGGRPRDYADAVLSLLAGIDRREDPGADLRSFALEHMNWQNEAIRIGSLYRSLVDGTSCAT